MRIFSNLRLLQLIDSTLLLTLLSVIALLLWFSLSNLSTKAQQNQQEAARAMQSAYTAVQQQMQLEELIDKQRKAYDALDDEFFRFARNPNSDRSNLPVLHALSDNLKAQSNELLQAWPKTSDPQLKIQFEEFTGIMTSLIDELESLSPGHWQQLARDAHHTAYNAKNLIEQLAAVDNQVGFQVMATIQESIQNTTSSTFQMSAQLDIIKYQALLSAIFIIAGLLASRFYFSSHFKQFIQTARSAQTVAEEAVNTKTRFLATMSHFKW